MITIWQDRIPDVSNMEVRERAVHLQGAMTDEIMELRSRVEALEKAATYALHSLEELVETIPYVEPNCYCHNSPPCHDCVENSHDRELLSQAKEAMEDLEALGLS